MKHHFSVRLLRQQSHQHHTKFRRVSVRDKLERVSNRFDIFAGFEISSQVV